MPWEAEHVPGEWIDVCIAYLAWKSAQENRAFEKARQNAGGGIPVNQKKKRPLNDPGEHKKPSSRR